MHTSRLAQCEEFVNKMPQGYKTIIGENGETLSGDKHQRVPIALVVLDNGNVAETGSPEELKKKKGIFSRMVERQTINANSNR